MNLQYLLPVKSECFKTGMDVETVIDSKGLMARLHMFSGPVYVTGEHDTVTKTSYELNLGETLDFVGKIRLLAGNNGCEAKVLYFDAI